MTSRKFSEEDTFMTYQAAYGTYVDWKSYLYEDVFNFMDTYQRGQNVSMHLSLPALFSLTSCICGPKSRIEGQGKSFSTCLNTYLIAICDPGGGKTVTFEKVIEPVTQAIYQETGKKIQIENYTHAGIQMHQIKNEGYGLITTDEGHRIMASINAKQQRGESERSTLCKMWSGKGDHIELSTGCRGFQSTSMSICLYIQPQPLMEELAQMCGADGFIDRFLFLASRPVLYKTAEVRENYENLKEFNIQDFSKIFLKMYEDHKDGKVYQLSSEAQEEYDSLVDSFAHFLDEKYSSLEDLGEDDKENIPCTPSPNLYMTTSKDTIHVLRIAAILHILTSYIRKQLQLEVNEDPIGLTISLETLQKARKLYSVLVQHKSIFIQAVTSLQKITASSIEKVQSFRKRILKCIQSSKGPFVTLRDIQRRLKGSLKDSILHELEELEKEGLGLLMKCGKVNRDAFLKSSPSTLRSLDKNTNVGISIEEYENSFKSMEKVDVKLLMKVLPSHPQHDEIVDWFKL